MYPQYINAGVQANAWTPTRKDEVEKYQNNLVCQCGHVATFDDKFCHLCIKAKTKREPLKSNKKIRKVLNE